MEKAQQRLLEAVAILLMSEHRDKGDDFPDKQQCEWAKSKIKEYVRTNPDFQ
jgi:hypothetical protein